MPNRERLEEMAEFLEGLDAKQDAGDGRGAEEYLKGGHWFNLGQWCEGIDLDGNDLLVGECHQKRPHCGTVGCAMGWAAFHRKWGLKPVFSGVLHEPSGSHDFGAASEVFGISYDNAMRLFHPDYYSVPTGEITATMVAARIRAEYDIPKKAVCNDTLSLMEGK